MDPGMLNLKNLPTNSELPLLFPCPVSQHPLRPPGQQSPGTPQSASSLLQLSWPDWFTPVYTAGVADLRSQRW